MNNKLKIYLSLVYSLFVISFIFFFYFQKGVVSLLEILFFMTIIFLSGNLSLIVNTGKKFFTCITLPLLMPAMAILGPFWTGVVSFIGVIKLPQLTTSFVWYKWFFNQSVSFMAAGGGALAFKLCQHYINSQYLICPFLIGALTYFMINNGLVIIAISLDKEKEDPSLVVYFIELLKSSLPSFFLGLIFYYSYVHFGKIAFILGIILIYIIRDFIFSRIQQLKSFTQLVESFLKVIDSKDHYTEGHCGRVANYVAVLSRKMGMNKRKIDRIVNMAKIHDIGKIYVDDEILKKSDKLSDREYEEMKNHSLYGYELLKDIDIMKKDLEIIHYHHEKYDGTGYPDGLEGEEIPEGARILNICDAFDVMTTGRTYKASMSKKQVIEDFKECSGGQFDPEVVENMLDLIKSGRFDDSFEKEFSFNQNIQSSLNSVGIDK